MTKRDFFRIVIRIFALYLLLLVVFNFIPSNLSYASYGFDFTVILWILGSSILMVLLFLLLLRKSDLVIDVLKLDNGFDDGRIELGSLNSLQIANLALIFIGGFLFLDHIPEFLQFCYLAFKKEVSNNGLGILEGSGIDGYMDYFRWSVSGINIILGYLIITNYLKIAKWITKKSK